MWFNSKKIIRNSDIAFHENKTIEDIKKPMKFLSSSAYDIVLHPAPSQTTIDDNKVHRKLPKAEQKWEKDVE